MIASLLFSRVYHAFPVMLSEIRLFAKKSPEIFMKCKHSAEKCGIIAAVCYKEKQRISRDKTHETDHTTQEDKTMAKIYVFLADGCEEIEALTPVDLLRRAGEDVCTVSIMGRKEVTGSHKITILADETIEEGEFDDGDMLVLPGGMPGTLNLAGNETLAALIRSYDDQGKKLAAICAAPSILGVMGILKDKNAVCFPGFEEKLAGANVLDVPAVTDKNVTTGRGMGAATDFALELIRVLQGEDKAKEMAEKIEITYQGSRKVVAAILDSAEEITRQKNDPAQGINEIDSILYVSLEEMGEIPEKGSDIEIGTKETGWVRYEIVKSHYEDGEIILNLMRYEE